jgi:hypothetical protein
LQVLRVLLSLWLWVLMPLPSWREPLLSDNRQSGLYLHESQRRTHRLRLYFEIARGVHLKSGNVHRVVHGGGCLNRPLSREAHTVRIHLKSQRRMRKRAETRVRVSLRSHWSLRPGMRLSVSGDPLVECNKSCL